MANTKKVFDTDFEIIPEGVKHTEWVDNPDDYYEAQMSLADVRALLNGKSVFIEFLNGEGMFIDLNTTCYREVEKKLDVVIES